MAALTIVSGSPGAGKTVLCSRLAKDSPIGLHIPTDLFYSFPAHPIDPTRPESQTQNEAIIRSFASASSSFLASGYDVFLDGIIGPWFLATLLNEIHSDFGVSYLILTTTPEVAVERVRNREGSGQSARVLATHRVFVELGLYETNRLDTTELTPENVYSEARDRLSTGQLALPRE